jgi:hypothetical protein
MRESGLTIFDGRGDSRRSSSPGQPVDQVVQLTSQVGDLIGDRGPGLIPIRISPTRSGQNLLDDVLDESRSQERLQGFEHRRVHIFE